MPSPQTPLLTTPLLIDAHVHLHDCFELSDFLNAALANFQQHSSQPITGALLLAEVKDVDAFSNRLKQSQSLASWTAQPTKEDCSVWFEHKEGHKILITAGRQIVTSEKIEVLALITHQKIQDGLSLEETLQQISAADALPVLPWGVGKWIGDRGQLVQQQLEASHKTLFAGDNGGRPALWKLPDYFYQKPQLPGSDPLPLESEVSRAGSYGFAIDAAIDSDKPGESLKQVLQQSASSMQTYGRSQPLLQFIKSQTLLRLNP